MDTQKPQVGDLVLVRNNWHLYIKDMHGYGITGLVTHVMFVNGGRSKHMRIVWCSDGKLGNVGMCYDQEDLLVVA